MILDLRQAERVNMKESFQREGKMSFILRKDDGA